jgi:DHA2 family multidrug resistance protein-like MFS transporter
MYRNAMSVNTPTGVPADAAMAARDTLGGALTVAGQLPDGTGTALLAAARDAFVHAMDVTAIISVALSLVMAGIAFALYRSQRRAMV